jgi:hypothetical protein
MAAVQVPLGPAPLDITGVRAGDLNEFQLTIRAGGTPVPLGGLTLSATARFKATDVDGVDAVIAVVDAPNGVIKIRWPGEDVRTWMADKLKVSGVWDLQMDDGTTDPVTIVAGAFSADMDVTR